MDNLDFNEAWKKINEEKFSLSSTIKKEEIMNAISKESSLTISELKKRLEYKFYWIIFFVVIAVGVMLWNLGNPIILGFLGLFVGLYVIGGYGLYKELKGMDDHIDSSKDTLTEMKKHRDIMKRALENEKKWGLVALPMISIGTLVFQKMLAGIPVKEFMTDPVFLITTTVLTIVLTFLGHWAAKKMNNKGYGSYMIDLEENIKKMEEL